MLLVVLQQKSLISVACMSRYASFLYNIFIRLTIWLSLRTIHFRLQHFCLQHFRFENKSSLFINPYGSKDMETWIILCITIHAIKSGYINPTIGNEVLRWCWDVNLNVDVDSFSFVGCRQSHCKKAERKRSSSASRNNKA